MASRGRPPRSDAPELLASAEALALVADYLAWALARSTAPVAIGDGAPTAETE